MRQLPPATDEKLPCNGIETNLHLHSPVGSQGLGFGVGHALGNGKDLFARVLPLGVDRSTDRHRREAVLRLFGVFGYCPKVVFQCRKVGFRLCNFLRIGQAQIVLQLISDRQIRRFP